ncbi:sulfurtransferase [Brachybacterium aquaticum]|uniref:Thiosulfate/3-mercaptopyruvate sulfurtransferase n=1 Tax=Brachybacterium aquaticum TaxID=1432564 RepID=A0A841AGF3_9MICO|nr:sulfurtransferase [Brachybacterium aquaticum]MBB5832415.1 thiosulfate/3-mercaptopyruvate sulfurtransferase [Brachybacterium aquaticum]
MSESLPPIIDVARLHELLDEPGEGPLLLDVRWALDGSTGRDQHLAAHLPGAVYVDLDTELAAPARVEAGRHPLPSPEDVAATLRRVGVTEDSRIVAYDDTDGGPAARLVWMLRALGHDAAVLSGGVHAWNGPLESGEVTPREGDVPVREWPATRIASADEVAALAASEDGVVLDARAPERYRGEVEPIDPRAGHVPGAVNLPYAGNLDAERRFQDPAALRERFAAAGVTEGRGTIVYCGSGVTATHDLLALESAGFTGARLFPGSWSQWSADPDRPVAEGPNP